ncbi:threonylcarbamoyl-AMP synthase [Aurantimicrobium sp. INA4]|uniref:L-threonylcarbamoyladenylate synthase n=1 Tax=Aurantimicrobium sp. INA4 TaxID=2986279 RepID=UPI0024908C10|nr:L-threonylcarbamoyladenylate synthase [Aurantimicrobium sp. INA4]BDU11557.1 threonylcarbamoyl-AMP synthase [Aurantimicrobium sp. INA4]
MTSADIARAATALKQGWLVAFPTETVYGLGADAENPEAVARIYRAKGRPADHPLIVHISTAELVDQWAREVPDYARTLARDFWPGPMTLILSRSTRAGDFVTGGQNTVGLRVPNNEIARELLGEFVYLGGFGVAAPSANRFGKVSPTTAAAVREELNDYLDSSDIVLDGEQSEVGIESTIIDCTSEAPRILRPGAITQEMIERSTGLRVKNADTSIRVSGSLDSHYAPRAKVVLNEQPLAGDGFIALSSVVTPEGVVRLAEPRTNIEYAKQLYSALRKADEMGLSRVVAITPEGDDIALAIVDRLKRASF